MDEGSVVRLVIQQEMRSNADDPQIQMAEDAATQLALTLRSATGYNEEYAYHYFYERDSEKYFERHGTQCHSRYAHRHYRRRSTWTDVE